MNKMAFCALLAMGAIVVQAEVAHAAFLGTFCWQKTPFSDKIKADISQDGATFLLHGTQAAPSYVIPFTGTIVSAPSGIIVGIVYANDPAFFGGSVALKDRGILNPATLNVAGTLIGDNFGPSSSTWVPIACPAGPFEPVVGSAPEGPEQGR
jgi:hypothetical protein